jgi:hypothetical protein
MIYGIYTKKSEMDGRAAMVGFSIRTRRKEFLKNLIHFIKSSRIFARQPCFQLIFLYMLLSDPALLESDPDHHCKRNKSSGNIWPHICNGCAVVTIFTYANKNAHLGYELHS